MERASATTQLWRHSRGCGSIGASDDIKATDSIVALLTASGLKDPEANALMLDKLVTVSGGINDVVFNQLKARTPIPA